MAYIVVDMNEIFTINVCIIIAFVMENVFAAAVIPF